MKESEKLEWIKKYLTQELTIEEQKAFKQLVEQHPDFEEEVVLAAAVNAQKKAERKEYWRKLIEKRI